jgi:site-specific DNA-methyltransferase (adenine-specific)
MKPTDILGNIKLYNADCMEVMRTFKDKQFSLAIVDPPYGIDVNMNMGKRKGEKDRYKNKEWDTAIPEKLYFDELKRVSENQIIWGGNYFTEYLKPSMGWICWDKVVPEGLSFSDFELAWTSFNKAAKKVRLSNSGFTAKHSGERIHPTQKLVSLYKWLLQNYAKEGDTILDTHFGSLSIGIACHDLKFDLTAIELDKDYYEMAKQRLFNHQKQLTLF